MAKIIRRAEVIFIAGGDQANYIRDWKDTPVQDAINANLAEGKPIGGTSAGLAVQGNLSTALSQTSPTTKPLCPPRFWPILTLSA